MWWRGTGWAELEACPAPFTAAPPTNTNHPKYLWHWSFLVWFFVFRLIWWKKLKLHIFSPFGKLRSKRTSFETLGNSIRMPFIVLWLLSFNYIYNRLQMGQSFLFHSLGKIKISAHWPKKFENKYLIPTYLMVKNENICLQCIRSMPIGLMLKMVVQLAIKN